MNIEKEPSSKVYGKQRREGVGGREWGRKGWESGLYKDREIGYYYRVGDKGGEGG